MPDGSIFVPGVQMIQSQQAKCMKTLFPRATRCPDLIKKLVN